VKSNDEMNIARGKLNKLRENPTSAPLRSSRMSREVTFDKAEAYS
jgi:hypothetical protein